MTAVAPTGATAFTFQPEYIMKREIIDRLVDREDGGLLTAARLSQGGWGVTYSRPGGEWVCGGLVIREQFCNNPARTHDLCCIAYVTWWAVEDPELTGKIKSTIRRQMAKYWVKHKEQTRADQYRKQHRSRVKVAHNDGHSNLCDCRCLVGHLLRRIIKRASSRRIRSASCVPE